LDAGSHADWLARQIRSSDGRSNLVVNSGKGGVLAHQRGSEIPGRRAQTHSTGAGDLDGDGFEALVVSLFDDVVSSAMGSEG